MKLSEIEEGFESYISYNFLGGIYEKFYKKEFKDIKNGELMGMIFDGYTDVNVLAPDIIFEDRFNNACIEYILASDDLDSIFYDTENPIWSGVPLIVKKINNHQVEEILSGEVFEINKYESMDSESLQNETYQIALNNYKNKRYDLMQQNILKYRNNNILINYSSYSDEKDGIYGFFIKIDDEYKHAYGEITLENKEEIISIIKETKKRANDYFEKKLMSNLEIIQTIANTDNVLYDVENKTKKELKMNLK